jgi:hypothetical protein
MNETKFIETPQAMDLLKVSKATFIKLIKEFDVTPYTINGGRKNFYKLSDIEHIVNIRNTPRPKNPVAA